jgi:hypothetical protein
MARFNRSLVALSALSLLSAASIQIVGASPEQASDGLRSVSSFSSIGSNDRRSVALFTEAAKVIQHPRCMNCHPVNRSPTQGDDMRPHQPPMFAGESGHGMPGLACSTCHGAQNVDTFSAGIKSIPGDPHWALAPASMSWQGKSASEICAQIKDPKRNGDRTLDQLHKHMADDHLVGWAWRPGAGREPAPGTQKIFGELIKAWIDTGARCPA